MSRGLNSAVRFPLTLHVRQARGTGVFLLTGAAVSAAVVPVTVTVEEGSVASPGAEDPGAGPSASFGLCYPPLRCLYFPLRKLWVIS